ncbi:MAG: DUF1127 domain-containing protein [Hyphomicrobiaceae bacterium]|jgi:uncharacterized protein YjiS (DUF1127 family)
MQQAQTRGTAVLETDFRSLISRTAKRGWLLWERQRQRRALLNLDEHHLRDIGMTREEALVEGQKPFWK